MKCEQIDEDYAIFKKTQLKINWWLRIILAKIVVKRALDNFLALGQSKADQRRITAHRRRIRARV